MCFLSCRSSKSNGAGSSDTPVPTRRATLPTETQTRVSRRSSPPVPPINTIITEQPKDDAAIIRLFSLIDNSITDHVINYYINNTPSSSDGDRFAQLGRNKREFIWVHRAAAGSAVNEKKMQVFIIRSIIGAEIFKAIRDGAFVPPAPGMNPNTKKSNSAGSNRSSSAAAIDHKSRIEFFHSLARNPQYPPHRQHAVSTLTEAIMQLTLPLVANRDYEEPRRRSLEAIVNSAADFAVIIGKQRPAFQIFFPPMRSGNSTGGSKKVRGENADMPVLVPELRKYGNEKGLEYGQYIPLVPLQKLPDGL